MKNRRLRVLEHLRAAQSWLSRAERSFDEKKTVRGELDLMLAQAELRRLQERKRDKKTRLRYALYRHGGALLCAVVLVGVGMFCWSSLPKEPAEVAEVPVSRVAIPNESTESSADVAELPTIEVKTVPVSKVTEEVKESIPIIESQNTAYDNAQPISRVSISREEMQELMQAAGRSLRGQ